MTAGLIAPAVPECDTPAVIFDELMCEIKDAIVNHPRSLQTRIGPSEIGEPCSRALIAKLMGVPEPPRPPNWRATVGTAIHSWLEDVFTNSYMQRALDGPRYLLEQRVTVGDIGGVPITGSCDLFDTLSGTVNDWKTKSRTSLQKHKRHGLGRKYRVQGHCYGRGMAAAGHRVNQVMFTFVLRDGEFADAFYLAEPYDEQIALDALVRANTLHSMASAFGVTEAQKLFTPCREDPAIPKWESENCHVCTSPKTSSTLAGLIPPPPA